MGRLTLIKSVLLATPVFWASLSWVPKGILGKIRRICSGFLWAGAKEESVLPWIAWDKVTKPKEWGGWGIKDLNAFTASLAAKVGWKIVKLENLWTKIVKRKYIDPSPLEDWIRNPEKKDGKVSTIWKATIEAFQVIEQGLSWKVGNGENIHIGRDPWVGCSENFALSHGLIRHLASKGIVYLKQVEKIGASSIWGQAWKSGEELNIHPRWWDEWEAFKIELSRTNVRIKDEPDQLIWAHADTGSYSPKYGYKFLMSKKGWGDPKWWAKSLWKLKCPAKAKTFFWCILKKKAPTWEILQSRCKQGPGRCALCKNDLETANHLFMECPTAKKVWSEVLKQMNLTIEWEGQSLSEAWQNWWNKIPEQKLRNLPATICWGIWIARNRHIFQEKETEAVQIKIRCLSIYSIILDAEDKRESRKVAEEQIKEGVP